MSTAVNAHHYFRHLPSFDETSFEIDCGLVSEDSKPKTAPEIFREWYLRCLGKETFDKNEHLWKGAGDSQYIEAAWESLCRDEHAFQKAEWYIEASKKSQSLVEERTAKAKKGNDKRKNDTTRSEGAQRGAKRPRQHEDTAQAAAQTAPLPPTDNNNNNTTSPPAPQECMKVLSSQIMSLEEPPQKSRKIYYNDSELVNSLVMIVMRKKTPQGLQELTDKLVELKNTVFEAVEGILDRCDGMDEEEDEEGESRKERFLKRLFAAFDHLNPHREPSWKTGLCSEMKIFSGTWLRHSVLNRSSLYIV